MKTILNEDTSCFTNEIQLSAGANQHQVNCLKFKQKLLDALQECDFFERHHEHHGAVGHIVPADKAEARPERVPSIESSLEQADSPVGSSEHLSEEEREEQPQQEEEQKDRKEVAESASEPSEGEMEILQTQAPTDQIPTSQEGQQHCKQLNICAAVAAAAAHQNQYQNQNQTDKQQYHQLQAQTKSTGLYQAPTAPTSQPQTSLISSQNHRNHLLNYHNQQQHEHQRHHQQQQARHRQPSPPTPSASPLLQTPQAPPKIYPNNTLVEDLTRCHDNLLPKVTRATARTIELFRSCLPNKITSSSGGICAKRAKRKEELEAAGLPSKSVLSAGYINNSIVLSQDEDESDENDKDSFQSDCDNCPTQARLAAKVAAPQVGQARARRRTTRSGRAKKFQMPESIVKLNSSLNQDDYNRALSILTNDVRYQLHLLLYRRLQTIWTLFTTIICILIPVLCVAHLETFVILGSCLLWLGLQAAGMAVTQQFCKKLDQMLEKAVAQVNSYFMDHNLMLGVINVGGMLTKARLVIPLLYFDTIQCREQIESIISVDMRKESDAGDKEQQLQLEQQHQPKGQNMQSKRKFALDYSKIGLRKIGPESQMSFAQSQLAKKIILRYSQRWISYFDKRKLMFNDDHVEPRHLSTGKCLCQFIEEHFRYDELDLNEPNGDDGAQEQRQQSQATAKAVVEAEQEAEKGCADVEHQSKELADMRARSSIVNMPNGKLDNRLDAGLNLATPIESRKIAPLGALSLHHRNGDNTNNISSSQQLDMLVPTLSHLVDMKERQEQFRISMDIGLAQESIAQQQANNNNNSNNAANCYASKLIHGFTTHLQQERLDSTSSPTTEHSFDLNDAGDLLPSSSYCSNDELLKRLKSLLESRKNEFSRSLVDGNLATNITSQYNSNNNSSAYAGRSPRMTGPGGDKSIRTQDSNDGSTQTVNQSDEGNSGGGGSGSSSSRMSQLGKRFFCQADGLFFLGAKKSQQGVYAKQQQVLEIC